MVPSGRAQLIDAFVRQRLAAQRLTPTPVADRRTLIRRLSFDLIGLPPTPDEVDAFVNDVSPHAYSDLVDRLLESPHYGERWARHWLDVARYTESQGYEYDRLRDNAWHYRDYVINSFNADKPYNLFMQEQIAGDVIQPVSRDGIVGASLLVCGPYDQAGNGQSNATQRAITREEELEEMISVVGQGFLGLTVNCARCHSHKFDPISQLEYYRIKSIFEGVKHGERPIDGAGEIAAREAGIATWKEKLQVAQQRLDEIETAGRQAAFVRRKDEQAELALTIQQARDAIASLERSEVSYAGTRVQPVPTRMLLRGDVTSPQQEVTPGALSAIAALDADFQLPADAPEAERRLRFAQWLADPRNPLPARVMVNRVWHWHFGQGLVATPSDFGVNGSPPTHPELLDWLASEFISQQWSLKSLHRLIVNSETYRQSSRFDPDAAKVDADNRLLWRYAPRRLEAEAVRDAMLAVSGQLNRAQGGPGFRPFTTSEFNASFYHPMDRDDPDFNRRTVYRINVNSGKDPLLETFDCPDPSVKTPVRGVTTTPLQALELMNNAFVQRMAGAMAKQLSAERPQDLRQEIDLAYQRVMNRAATADELNRSLQLAEQHGLARVCWVLLNSTEFVYVQ